MANEQNLIPNNQRSPKELRDNGRKGGLKSVEVRRARKTLKETLLMMLEEGNTQDNITLALLDKALKGDTTAIIFWLKNRRPDKWRDRKEHSEIDIAQKELELKTKKLMLEEQKFNDESKDEAIKIQIVKASDRVCKK